MQIIDHEALDPYARPNFMIVAFTGQDGSGKSTAAQMLTEQTGWPVIPFAEPLKEILREVDPILAGDLIYLGNGCDCCEDVADTVDITLSNAMFDCKRNELELKDQYPEYRRLLRATGEAIKRFQPSYFADVWLNRAVTHRTGYQMRREGAKSGVIADDLRFPVEWDALVNTSRNYREQPVLVRVVKPGIEGGDHASETMQDELVPDVVIENAGTLDDLAREVQQLHIHLMGLSRNPGGAHGSR